VTSSAAPPLGHTVTLYKASWPECTLLVAAATLTQISDVAAVLGELLDAVQLLDPEGCARAAGVPVGVGPAGVVVGAEGST